MKIKNISNRIIGIGNVVSLPDQIVEVSDSEENNPAIACLVERKELEVLKEEKYKMYESEKYEPEKETVEDSKEDAPEEPKKRGGRPKKDATKE